MYVVLTARREIAAAQRQLETRMGKGLQVKTIITFRPAPIARTVSWFPAHGIWHYAAHVGKDDGVERYWNAFGTADPTTLNRVNIAVEINPPVDGTDRTVNGIFLRDEDGVVYLGHRANRVNQVKKDVLRAEFREGRRGKWVTALDGKGEKDVLLLHAIGSPGLLGVVSDFVKEVDRIKRGEKAPAAAKGGYDPEFDGECELPGGHDPVTYTRTHGKVCNGLQQVVQAMLKEAGRSAASSNNPHDLLVVGPKVKPVLFECKTRASRSNIFAGIGQLMLYPNALNCSPAKVLVLPDDTDARGYEAALGALGIDVIYFTLKDDNPSFKGLRSLFGL